MTRQPTPQEKDKWAAQRQEKLTALQGQLADGLQQLMEATGWMNWRKVAHHFHTCSTGRVGVFQPREYSVRPTQHDSLQGDEMLAVRGRGA